MSSQVERQAIDRTRFTVDLPPHTTDRLEKVLVKTGMTRTQLMIMMVEQAYVNLVEERAA